ncbi:g3204 [Coccomyxa elongata]
MHQYQSAQQHDPQIKVAIAVFYTIILTMILAQSGLFWWKKKHKRSYELVTLLGLWIVPAVISFHMRYWRFLSVWVIYSGMTLYMLSLCSVGRMDRSTPKRVYKWFSSIYMLSVGLGVVGYILMAMLGFLEAGGVGPQLRAALPSLHSLCISLLWYGLYFGVLGRDCAEVAADRMASLIGMQRQMAVSVRSCGICGEDLQDFGAVMSAREVAAGGTSEGSGQGTVQLGCKHCFHPDCIRGWTIVGKKDTCPTCLEKVDMRKIFAGRPWETRNLTWIQMLDSIRYLIVWNPVLLLALHFFLHFFGIDKFSKHRGDKEALMIMTNGTFYDDLLHVNITALNVTQTFL